MCDPILVTLLKMRLHYSQSSRENATLSSGTSPLASCKEVLPLRGWIGLLPDASFIGDIFIEEIRAWSHDSNVAAATLDTLAISLDLICSDSLDSCCAYYLTPPSILLLLF